MEIKSEEINRNKNIEAEQNMIIFEINKKGCKNEEEQDKF